MLKSADDRDIKLGENARMVFANMAAQKRYGQSLFSAALDMVMAMQQRTWMQGLWDASKAFDLPAKFTPIYSS